MVQTCCEAVKSLKIIKKCWKTLELDYQVARVKKFEEIMMGHPPGHPLGHPLPAKTLIVAPRTINLGGDISILVFWP